MKPWWQSRTIWGVLVSLAGGLAALLGREFTTADQEQLLEALSAIAIAAGSILAIIGRVKASKKLGG